MESMFFQLFFENKISILFSNTFSTPFSKFLQSSQLCKKFNKVPYTCFLKLFFSETQPSKTGLCLIELKVRPAVTFFLKFSLVQYRASKVFRNDEKTNNFFCFSTFHKVAICKQSAMSIRVKQKTVKFGFFHCNGNKFCMVFRIHVHSQPFRLEKVYSSYFFNRIYEI